MFINNLDPVAISLFSFEIKWYSLSYIFGIIFGWMYAKKIIRKATEILNRKSGANPYLLHEQLEQNMQANVGITK